jgi:hypothetical protein
MSGIIDENSATEDDEGPGRKLRAPSGVAPKYDHNDLNAQLLLLVC